MKKHLLAVLALLSAAASFAIPARQVQRAPEEGGDAGEPAPAPAGEFTVPDPLDIFTPEEMPSVGYVNPDRERQNIAAFGAAVAKAEGTASGPNAGYDVLFGWPASGRSFDSRSASDHPRKRFPFTDKNGVSNVTTAAGRYQENVPTYEDIRARYRIPPGFTPQLQEQHFVAILADCGALDAVKAGRFDEAVQRARPRWASLPGAGYAQPERTLHYVRQAYIAAGGTFA